MRILQLYTGITQGDGVSNIILSLSRLFTENNIENKIIVRSIGQKISQENISTFENVEDILENADDIIICHLANGNALNYDFEHLKCKKILFYHNISYPYFFRSWNERVATNCALGEVDARETVGNYMKAICLSEFSRNQLIEYGWEPDNVYSIPFIDYAPDVSEASSMKKWLNRDSCNFLFVGRISPNKRIEDIIKVFAYYQREYNVDATLTLVGNIQFQEYYECLCDYIDDIGVRNVKFKGHVTDAELKTCYSEADIFLCMSEHEGFCIPILEAMACNNLVVGYAASAVPCTMGEAGILVDTKDERVIAETIADVIQDKNKLKDVLNRQHKRIEELDFYKQGNRILDVIKEVEAMGPPTYRFESNVLRKYRKKNEDSIIDKPILDFIREKKKTVVIYGAGKAGQQVYDRLSRYLPEIEFVFCDNGIAETKYKGIEVLKHEKCVVTYGNAVYLVTVQNYLLDVFANLVKDGIAYTNICVYEMSHEKWLKSKE